MALPSSIKSRECPDQIRNLNKDCVPILIGGSSRPQSRTCDSIPVPHQNFQSWKEAESAAISQVTTDDDWGKDGNSFFDDIEVIEAAPLQSNSMNVDHTSVPAPPVISVAEVDLLHITKFGLPPKVTAAYMSAGIQRLFPWQAECLRKPGVLEGRNLVYSAPTSAGKTLVSEILLLKRVSESGKKGLFILPFVALAREKMLAMQKLCKCSKLRVDGFMGQLHPKAGLALLDIAICTIEKANSLINRIIEENRLHEIGIIVVDELHLVGDPSRGYLIELLLTKIRYLNEIVFSRVPEDEKLRNSIQIIAMSATLPNLSLVSKWLSAELLISDYRPVPLYERLKIGSNIFDKSGTKVCEVPKFPHIRNDPDSVIALCFETVQAGHSVLIFCPTKNWCEKLSETIANQFALFDRPTRQNFIQSEKLMDVVEQLRRTPAGLDPMLSKIIPHIVAFHHAGLTIDERDIIEGAFKKGYIKILIATTTLSAGVNLPARRVIIRSVMFNKTTIDLLTYYQMAGRAGRKGVDSQGESILMVAENEVRNAKLLLTSEMQPVASCLNLGSQGETSSMMLRAVLESVVNRSTKNLGDVANYISCTLFAAGLDSSTTTFCTMGIIDTLKSMLLITVTENNDLLATQLGKAVVWSGLSASEGDAVLHELEKARGQLSLENELHILYLVTPIYMLSQFSNMDWFLYLEIWEKLPSDWRRVGNIIGVDESALASAARGRMELSTDSAVKARFSYMRRFYCALILNELVHEVPLSVVAQKYQCNKGVLQSLQQGSSSYAGMITVFCEELGWSNMALLLSQFQSRLLFGVTNELVDLARIECLSVRQLRAIYEAGHKNLKKLQNAKTENIADILRSAVPYLRVNTGTSASTSKIYNIQLKGHDPMSETEAADFVIEEACRIVQAELEAEGVRVVSPAKLTEKHMKRKKSYEITLKKRQKSGTMQRLKPKKESINATAIIRI